MKKLPYFLTFADLPPSPFDEEKLSWYKELFNAYILTEDDVKLVDPTTKSLSNDYLKALEILKAKDINVLIRNMYNDPNYFDSNEKDGSNYGYPYHLEERHIKDEFNNYDNIIGFYMMDEPFMKEFSLHKEYANLDSLVTLVDYKNKYYDDMMFHVNHVPSSSYDHYYFNDSNGLPLNYKDFINYYVENILKRLKNGERSLSLDNYPFVYKDYIAPDYLFDLLTVSNITRDYNETCLDKDKARFGTCIQTFVAHLPSDSSIYRDIISYKEITFQLFTSIALGARQFEYFCYECFPECEGAILDKNGNKRIFDLVKKANEIALPFGDYLNGYKYVGATMLRGENPYIAYKSHFCKDLFINDLGMIEDYKVSSDVLLGRFIKDDSEIYVLVNFSDPIQNRDVDIEIKLTENKGILIYKNNIENLYKNNSVSTKVESGNAILMKVNK